MAVRRDVRIKPWNATKNMCTMNFINGLHVSSEAVSCALPCSVLNVINSAVNNSAVLLNYQSGSALEAWERSKLCNLGAEVIRPSTRCFSFLGYQLVPLLGALFMVSIWHFVFWQELWRLPRSTILKGSMSTQRPHRKTAMSHDELGILAFSDLQVRRFGA